MPQLDKKWPVDSELLTSPILARRHSRFNLPSLIWREYMTCIQQRSFQIITTILFLLIILGASTPTIFALLTSGSQTQIAVVNTAGMIGNLDQQGLLRYLDVNLNRNLAQSHTSIPADNTHFSVRLALPGDLDNLRQQVRNKQLAVLLQITRTSSGDLVFVYYTDETLTQNLDLAQVQAVATQLHIQDTLSHLGMSASQAATILTPVDFQAQSTLQQQNAQSPLERNAAVIVSMFTIVLLFIFIQQYCSLVSIGVVEEKRSRIMETLISATTPFQLLSGKIIGIGLVGVTQMGLVCLAGGAVLLAQEPLKHILKIADSNSFAQLDLGAIFFEMLPLMLLFFVLGYLFYAPLYAAAGVLVSRQEEVAASIAPLAFLGTVSYLVSFSAIVVPHLSWVVLLSYVPFFTPMLMLAREAVAPLPWWEIILSSVLMLAAILLLTRLATSIYRVGMLMYGPKPGFEAVFRYLRATNHAKP